MNEYQRLASLIRQLQGALGGRRMDTVGIVSAAGAIVAGGGFTVNKTGTGTYDIAYDEPFGFDPVVQLTAGATGGPLALKVSVRSASGCSVIVFNTTTAANADGEFYLSVIG